MINSIITKKSKILILLLSITISTNAQISVNTTGDTANISAMLDVSSTDKGMLIPRMTSAQRAAISTPADGLLVFDTTTDSFWYYNGTAVEWQKVGNAVAGATEINELSDGIVVGSSLFMGNGSGINNNNIYSDNLGIGPNALHLSTSGIWNTAVGSGALEDNTTGHSNTAIGYAVLAGNINGYYNTAIGASSLQNNTTGFSNVSIGYNSSASNNTGNYNIAIGEGANFSNQGGSYNTIIGQSAGGRLGSHSKSGNIFLGYLAGYNEIGDNKLYIENSNSATPLIGGDFASDYVDINGDLNLSGSIKIEGGIPGANKILTSDADGNATWETNNAASEINHLSDAIYDGSSLFLGVSAGESDNGTTQNVGVGKYALQNNTIGIMNTSTGVYALQTNTSGQNNTAFGNSTLKSNSAGNYNTAMGSTALQNNTTSDNTAFGYAAMITNTSGYKNVAVGVNALKLNVNGFYNVAVGYESLKSVQSGTYNSAFGANSLFNTTGNRNTGSGFYSLYSNTTGSYNTAFGYRSGYENTTGTYNTFLGYNARVNNTTAKTNSTAVGNDAIITASNQVRIGNASVTDIGGYADWTNISDKRFKYNISEDVSGLDFIMKLRPVSYNLDIQKINNFLGVEIDGVDTESVTKKSNIRQSGFIAQEVEEAAKKLGFDFSGIDTPENENDHYGLRYAQFVVPLVKAVQELSGHNDQLVEIVSEQQEVINKLEQENIELKKLQQEIEEIKESIKKLEK